MGEVEIQDSPELHDAIEQLYAAFAGYPLRKRVTGCPHCVFDSDIRSLHAAPLHSLGMENLSKFAWKTMTTWGDVNDFKHFLPRLFELAVYDNYGYGLDFLFGKLAYGKFQEWPFAEQTAFRIFFLAWWQAFIAVYPNTEDTLRFFRFGAPYLIGTRPFLDALGHPATLAEQCHLVEFCADLGECAGGYVPDWPDAPHIARQVLDWFLDESLLATLAQALAAFAANGPHQPGDWHFEWLKDTVAELLGKQQ